MNTEKTLMSNKFAPSIEIDEINTYPVLQFKGEIVVVNTPDDLSSIIPLLSKEKIWGFDTETKPSFKRGVANKVCLMQIANEDTCYLIRLNQTGFSNELKEWIEDKSIQKIGLSLKDDVRELNKLIKLHPNGFVDLQKIVGNFGIEELSLKKVSAIVLGGKISKKQRLTNWESKVLNSGQMTYAATDAWVCLKIYNELMKKN